jgi:hypothetical protein
VAANLGGLVIAALVIPAAVSLAVVLARRDVM